MNEMIFMCAILPVGQSAVVHADVCSRVGVRQHDVVVVALAQLASTVLVADEHLVDLTIFLIKNHQKWLFSHLGKGEGYHHSPPKKAPPICMEGCIDHPSTNIIRFH